MKLEVYLFEMLQGMGDKFDLFRCFRSERERCFFFAFNFGQMATEPYEMSLLWLLLWILCLYIRKWVKGTDARYEKHEHIV